MIVLKAPQDQVLGALQAIAGLVERRHTSPVLANVLLRRRGATTAYADYVHLRLQPFLTRLLPALPPPCVEFLRPLVRLARGRLPELRGFFGATKVNARNAP